MKTNQSALILPPHPPVTASSTNDIREIRAPVEIPNPWIWAGWIALGLALALLGWWLWRKFRKKLSEPKPQVIIPPHVRARERLREALGLIGQPRPFCIAVSDAIRAYLEERFDFRAPERTTEEFIEELQGTPTLSHEQKSLLGEFLNRCDLVKFARYEPTQEELQKLHDVAVRLVVETEPPPIAPAMPPGTEQQPPAEPVPR